MASYSGRKEIQGHTLDMTFEKGRKIENWPTDGPMESSISFEGPSIITAGAEYVALLGMGRIKIPSMLHKLCAEPFELQVIEFMHNEFVELSGENRQARMLTRLAMSHMEDEVGAIIDFTFKFGAKGKFGKAADPLITPILNIVAPPFVDQFHQKVIADLGAPAMSSTRLCEAA